MRKPMMILGAVALLAGGTLALTQADAQGAPPPPPGEMRPMGPPPGRPMMDEHEHGQEHHGGWMRQMRQFALIYPARDRNLSGADVQTIAEAFLLFNGNHSWRITSVTEEPNRVTFAIATPDGTAIAHFAMDRHTARPQRID